MEKRKYVPTTLDQYINESKSITLKRGYGQKKPVVVGTNAPIRNQVLAYVAENQRVGSSNLKRFVAGLNETSKNPNAAATMWLRRNGKFFMTESRNGRTFYKLSSLGERLVNRFAPVGLSEMERPKKTIKSDGKAEDAKKGQEDNMILDDEEELDESNQVAPKLGGKYKDKYHNLLDKDENKDDNEIAGYEKEISESRKARIQNLIEKIEEKTKKDALNEAEEEEEDEEKGGSADELSFDDLDLEGEEKEGDKGEEKEGEEGEEGEKELDLDDEETDDDEAEGEEDDDDKVEITEFIITVDDPDGAIEELEELGVEASRVPAEMSECSTSVNEEEEVDIEDNEDDQDDSADSDDDSDEEDDKEYSDTEISVSADNWEALRGWLEDKGVDVEEMFGGEIEVEEVEDDEDLDLDSEEGEGDLDLDLDSEGEEGEEGEEGGDDLDLDLDLDLEDEEVEEGSVGSMEEPDVEESLTGMENHEDDTNNLIKGAKQVVINYK